MSKLSEAVAADNVKPGGTCPIRKSLTELDKASAADLRAMLADPNIFASVIARGLRKMGHKVTDDAVRAHRRPAGDGCACDKAGA